MAEEKKPAEDDRSQRQQYHEGDLVWITRSKDVTDAEREAVLKDQEDRRKAFLRKRVTDAVKAKRKPSDQ